MGYFAVDEGERRMEWVAEEGRDYSGWLTVAERGEGGSEVVVHLSFGERSAGPEIREQSPEGQQPLGGGRLGDTGEHPSADRGGLGQVGGPAPAGGNRTAARREPGGGRSGSPAGPNAGLTSPAVLTKNSWKQALSEAREQTRESEHGLGRLE